nr:transposase family protein [Brucella anthropi]
MKTLAQRMSEIDELRPPAQIAVFVDVLGLELTIEFLLAFGGSPIQLSARPQAGSLLSEILSLEQISALAKKTGGGWHRVPTCKPFLCSYFSAKNMSVSAIARKLHITDTTVRSMIRREADRMQLSLFD